MGSIFLDSVCKTAPTLESLFKIRNNIKKETTKNRFLFYGAERGIRTPGQLPVNSFQDCRNRPLYHLCIFHPNGLTLVNSLFRGVATYKTAVIIPPKQFTK